MTIIARGVAEAEAGLAQRESRIAADGERRKNAGAA